MSMKSIRSEKDLDAAIASGTVLIFKHSTRCGVSAAARTQVEAFAESCPNTPVYLIDVVESRALSSAVAERFGVRHESPQVILVRDGKPVWHTSHFRITRNALAEHAG